MKPRVDVAVLSTGIALTGIGTLGGLIAAGYELVQPVTVWFSGALLLAGFIGLGISLRRNSRDGR